MSAEGQTIPEDIRDIAKATAGALIGRMCATMDHSFGLQNEQQQRGLKTSMSQSSSTTSHRPWRRPSMRRGSAALPSPETQR
ncbi:hypothetical protein [Rhizobiales bacterium]|uniref:hypothetical protein n=1 Tax=Ensifer sp. R-19 TaxID=3404055 RepID=UPI000DDE8AA2